MDMINRQGIVEVHHTGIHFPLGVDKGRTNAVTTLITRVVSALEPFNSGNVPDPFINLGKGRFLVILSNQGPNL